MSHTNNARPIFYLISRQINKYG